MNVRHLSDFVIRPVLAYVGDGMPGFASDAAVELLLGTAAHESGFRSLDQITGPNDRVLGPAYGIYQIEPATMRDAFEHYLDSPRRAALRDRVQSLAGAWPAPEIQLVTNLAWATAIARLVYWRSPVPLAPAGDIEGHARVWKRIYNTPQGKGTEAAFTDAYRRLVAPNLP